MTPFRTLTPAAAPNTLPPKESRHGHPLKNAVDGIYTCPESGLRYQETAPGVLRCLDLAEESPLPTALATGSKPYREFKSNPAEPEPK